MPTLGNQLEEKHMGKARKEASTMSKLLHAMAAKIGIKPASDQPQAGVFSTIHGSRGNLEKLGTRAANTKCAGECTCRCCK